MRRAAVVSVVAAVGTVVVVPAASAMADSVSGSCRADGFRGSAKLVYNKVGGVYRPTGMTVGAGPHLGETEPALVRARMRISHVEGHEEIVDFDKTRRGLETGGSVAEPVEDVAIPITTSMTMSVTFTFVRPGGTRLTCRVVKEVDAFTS
ncbi:hypothetical protein JOF56_010859 [Kibdelosporangium banguiense]|uniref:Uncharacterized protein n=1 Tax=Kibdelosporangium banguiense TaxID=1365924 RepID=A0ABS4U2N0_9PSEU|nr:hypothetical protein [Kibdelosporangium banguiense]MBP2330474.1 hypothetical protein [Kibdelosporangium banguiense]